MDNTTPAAAAPATEATPTTNVNDATPATPAPDAPAAPQADIPADQIEAFNKFVKSNGGFNKAFDKLKQAISNPQPQAPVEPQQPIAPQAVGQRVESVQPQPFKPAEGFITPNEITALQYNKFLAEAYPEIKDYVDKGEYLKEAQALGIQVMDKQGNMNDRAIRAFLDLKKQATQPNAPSEPITATPTNTYATIEGEIDSPEKATQIMGQGEGHPQYQAAVTYMRQRIFPKKTQEQK